MPTTHHVYLALCADGTYYCGYALDPRRRLDAHNAGKGSKILRGKLPVRLAYVRRFAAKGDALRFERTLKACAHAHKRKLAASWRKKASQKWRPYL